MGKKSKTTTEPSKYAKQYITPAANAVTDAYNANSGAIQNATNQVTSLLPSAISSYGAEDPTMTAANQYVQNTLNSSYDQNPYLDQVLANSNNDVKNQLQASLGLKGLTGGSDYAGIIANKIAENSLNTRYTDYNNWADRQANAAGLAGNLATSQAAVDSSNIGNITSLLSAYLTPTQAASGYASSIGGLLGNSTTTTQKNSLLSSLLQAGSNAAAAYASSGSDIRLKKDVKRIGYTDGGLPIYSYCYKAGGPHVFGVMAQDVAQMQPDALGPEVGGYMTVMYGEVR